MNKKQQAEYDKTCKFLREFFTSYNNAATQLFSVTGEGVTGETVRNWMIERRMPAEIVFVMYELTDKAFDPLSLLPWLRRWVILK